MSANLLEGPVDEVERVHNFFNKICGATYFPELAEELSK